MAKGKGVLRIAIEDFLETFDLGKILAKWIKGITDTLEDEFIKVSLSVSKGLGVYDYIPDQLKPDKVKQTYGKAPAVAAIVITGLIGIGIGMVAGAISPVINIFRYQTERIIKSYRPDPFTLLLLQRRDPRISSIIDDYMKDLGLTDPMREAFKEASDQPLNAYEAIVLYRRGHIDYNEFVKICGKSGYNPKDTFSLLQVTRVIPTPTDLIRMAVREAFSPETVERFQYQEGFPTELLPFTESQGLDEDWVRRYWSAHWDLPGVMQAFEMLHRLRPGMTQYPFTESDLDLFLKTADIAPYFRPRLKEISYNPFTRVDVRRMYGAGVLNKDQVYNAYRDIGYDDFKAQKLTEFTVTIEASEEKGLTRGAITGGYSRGLISRDQALSMLQDIGYNAEQADFWLDIEDIDLEKQKTDEKLKYIEKAYVEGILDESTVYDQVGRLNLPTERLTELLRLWTIKRESKLTMPSRSDLDKFYLNNIISKPDYESWMLRRGYHPGSIPYYTKMLDIQASNDAKQEVERSEKEKERLDISKRSTEYQKKKAGYDLEIAMLKQEIADIKVALHNIVDEEIQARLVLRVDEVKSIIASIEVEKAELKYVYVSPK